MVPQPRSSSWKKEWDKEIPLPFSFIIATESLKVALDEATNKAIFKGITMPNFGHSISLFQYAYDTIFMGKWLRDNTKNLMRILTCFHLASDLMVNLHTSNLMAIGVPSREVSSTAKWLKCLKSELPFSYIGMIYW